MSGWELVLSGLRWRWLASLLNTLGVALGVALVCAVLLIQAEIRARFEEPGRGFGLVVGAPGSATQLVLSAVFQLDESPGRVPLALWDELASHPSAALVVPYAVGDSFRGFPVIATTEAFFDPRFPHPAGERPVDKLRAGRPLRYDAAALPNGSAADGRHRDEPPGREADEHRDEADEPERAVDEHEHDEHDHGASEHEHGAGVREAVLGADVARTVHARVGDRIELAHGLDEGALAHEHEAMWEVVGILARTGTSLDRAVLINLDSFFTMEDHLDGEPGLSALLVFPRRGVHTAVLMGELRGRSDLQVAHVSTEVGRLLALIGPVDALLLLIAQLVVVVALLSIFASTYLAMHARRGEVGVLRALGVARRRVLMLIVTEAALLAFVGAVVGCLGAHVLLHVAGGALESLAGFAPDANRVVWTEGPVVALVAAAGGLAGLLPGVQAYRADVATSLRYAD